MLAATALTFLIEESKQASLKTYSSTLAGSITRQITLANAPPTKGPTMKIHKLLNAETGPPAHCARKAGPIERAGLTDVPV